MKRYHGGPWGRANFIDRFWDKVDRSGHCWTWKAHVDNGGYGVFWHDGANVLAHRFSYELHHGVIPDGLCVCHSCDVNYPPGDRTYRRCVNPDHMWVGTVKENFEDMIAKGRQATGDRTLARKFPERVARGDRSGSRLHPETRPRGEQHWMRHLPGRIARGGRNGRSKLTESEVRDIKQEVLTSRTDLSVAQEYGVSEDCIRAIRRGRTWRHVR